MKIKGGGSRGNNIFLWQILEMFGKDKWKILVFQQIEI
jgi:hypothetical protein